MATREQLESALRGADKAGDVEAARVLATALKNGDYSEPDSFIDDVRDVAGEFAAGANRTIMWPVDTAVSVVNLIPGVDLPKPSSKLPGIDGGFMDEGTARDAVRAAGEVLGPGGMAMTPVKGRNLASTPQAAAEFLGFGSKASPAMVAEAGEAVTDGVARDLALKRNSGDVAAAGYKFEDGAAINDPIQKQLMKLGVKDSIVSQINAASPSTKYRLNQALSILEEGRKNESYANRFRPLDAAGESVMNRVRHVYGKNREAATQLDAVANRLRGQQVDFANPVKGFLAELKDRGVKIDSDFEVNLQGSDFEGGEAVEKFLNRVVRRMVDTNSPDAYDVHRLKKFIDNQVDMGKRGEGWSGQAERIVKKLRHDLDTTLDSTFQDYNQVNSQYADTRQALDALQELAGKRIDLGGKNADTAVGTLTRRLLSNAQSRVPLMDAIEQLDQTAGKYGGAFDDDVLTQVSFVNELERLLGASGYTSLQGDVSKAGENIARAAMGDTSGIFDMTTKGLVKPFVKTQDQRERELIQVLRKMLNDAPAKS